MAPAIRTGTRIRTQWTSWRRRASKLWEMCCWKHCRRWSGNKETMDGIIVADKPTGWTSHDLVNKLRRLAGTRKVGHLGTLDPMATGVLPLVIGRATRLAQFFSSSEKAYDARIQFGWATDTYDREGSPTSQPVAPHFTRAEFDHVLERFRGTILQTPPPFSAKKIAGRPAYRLARKHIAVELAPVEL